MHHLLRIKSLLILFLLLLAGLDSRAQVYPVQVTVVPTPPHRNYLNSFSEQGALNVFLTLTDFNSGPVSVKLKMELNGPGYQFRSLPNNLVYVLNPGQPVQVPVEDLAVFFSSAGQSLSFNPTKLPEGNTSVCVDVIKNQSGELLSNNGCGYFYMGYGQPATLLQPACNATVQLPAGYPASTDLSTLPLQFNFIPAIAPVGLQQEVENTLYIYNWLGTVNSNPPLIPTGLVLAVDPIELGSLTTHTLLPVNNQLIVGQEYVWYVKTSLNGSTNQFQNGGWSAPCKFKYGAAQSIEEVLANGLSVEWVDLASNSESKGTGTWKVVKEDPNSSGTFNQFILKYRKKVPPGQQPFEWFSDTVNSLSKAIYQLEPSTTYEATVAGRLGSFVSEPTEVRTFTTAPPRTYACGVANFPGRATAFQPLEYADPGMKVKIGMFQLEFVSVQKTGQPGHFSGTGLIPVDFLFGAEARVKFDNLKIDKEYDVWEGTAHVITDGLDSWLEEQYQQFQDPIFVNGTVDSAYVSDSIAHVIIDGVDTTFTFPCATCPVIINDVAGNQVTIYPNGTVIWSSFLDVSDEQLDVPDSEIGVFAQHAQETGGFDPFEHIAWNANYEIIRTSNAVNYFVANKSLKKGQTDKVSLSVPANQYTETNVKLSWAGLTTPLSPVSSAVANGKRVFVFDLPAFSQADEFAIYAVSDNLKIGKLNAVVYEPIEKRVVIVPLAGTVDASQLSAQLNSTLGEAGMSFTVAISDTAGVGKFASNSALNIPDATLMSKYSGKMRQIRNGYFDKHELENDTYYLFVVAALTDSITNQSVDGYMVRGKSIGFIHAGSSLLTYAHELGHGIGALEHSWKNNGPAQGETNNLMDYSNGENLILAQWKLLRDPKGSGFWDEEEDGSSVTLGIADIPENFKNDNGTYSFVAPSGEIVTLPPNLEKVTFSTMDPLVYLFSGEYSGKGAPVGSLFEFSLKQADGKTAEFEFRGQGNTSYYRNSDDSKNEQPVDTLNPDYSNWIHYSDFLTHEISQPKVIFGFAYYENDVIGFNLYCDRRLDHDTESGKYTYQLPSNGFFAIDRIRVDNPNSSDWIEAGDYYADWFKSRQGLKVKISADMTDLKFSPLAIDYLHKFRDWAKSDNICAPLVIAIAQWVSSYSAVEHISECLLSNMDPVGPLFNPYSNSLGLVPIPDLKSVTTLSIQEEMSSNDVGVYQQNQSMEYEILYKKIWKYYQSFSQAQQQIAQGFDIEIALNNGIEYATNATSIAFILNQYKTTDLCNFWLLSFDNRLKAINYLKYHDEHLGLVADLTITAKDNLQNGAIIDAYFSNNAKLYWKVVKTMTSGINNDNYDRFVHSLLKMSILNNPDKTYVDQINFIPDEKHKLISLGHDEYPEENYYQFYATRFYTNCIPASCDSSFNKSFYPNQFIKVGFNFITSNSLSTQTQRECLNYYRGIEFSGKELVIPAFYLSYLEDNRDYGRRMKAVQFLGDAVVILFTITAAPESLLFIDKIAVVVAASDIVVQVNEPLIRELDGGDTFMQLWSYVQVVDGVAGGLTIAKGITKSVVGTITKVLVHPDEIIAAMKSNAANLKAEALNSYEILKEAYRFMRSAKPQAASDFYKYLFQRIEAVKLRIYNTTIKNSAYDIIVLNEYNVAIKSQTTTKNILVLDQNSSGTFLKGSINYGTPPNGSTLCATFDNVRYRNNGDNTIHEGNLNIYKTSSGIFGVFEELSNSGRITTTAELKEFLVSIDETTTMIQLEQKGIKSLFRGTTRSKADNSLFSGNANSQEFGISTSTDPIKATIFSIESATSNGDYNGVLQIGLTSDLRSVGLNAPNIYRCEKELEVVLQTPANNFASLSNVEISVENARKLVKEVYGIDLPSKIYSTGLYNSNELLETLPASSLEKAFEFYQKALQYNLK